MLKPSVGRIVHYVSRGSADGVYVSECRAAIITAIDEYQNSDDNSFVGHVNLCVLNPEGMLFNRGCHYHSGAETPGDPNCSAPHANGPHRYCACGWSEARYEGGSWHWPERVEEDQ